MSQGRFQPFLQSTSQERGYRKRHIDEMYDKISLDDDDRTRSRAYVDETMKKLISNVRQQQYGKIYGHQIVKAGSYPIKAKIGKADEFDTNIFFNIEPEKLKVSCQGEVYYKFDEESLIQNAQANMQTDVELVRTEYGQTIPEGYAVVTVDVNEVPPYLRHEGLQQPHTSNRYAGSGPTYTPIIPRDVKQDLHLKIKTARYDGISVTNACHGPALTLTISPDLRSGIAHKISVDVTVSLKCSLRFKDWPRPNTKKAFDKALIEAAIEAGIHLVPKKDLFWAISYSRAERALLSAIDKEFGCRKRVLKLLKKYLATCQARPTSKLTGMSSHVLKTQVLWSCEDHADDPGYWRYENRDICLINTMSELEYSLRREQLPDYFNVSINVLHGKAPGVCAELAKFIRCEMTKLEQMV